MKSRIEITTNPGFGIRWTAFSFNRGWLVVGEGVEAYETQAQFAASQAIAKFIPPTYGDK